MHVVDNLHVVLTFEVKRCKYYTCTKQTFTNLQVRAAIAATTQLILELIVRKIISNYFDNCLIIEEIYEQKKSKESCIFFFHIILN